MNNLQVDAQPTLLGSQQALPALRIRVGTGLALLACLALFWSQIHGFVIGTLTQWFTHPQGGRGDLVGSALILALFVGAGGLLRLLWPSVHSGPMPDERDDVPRQANDPEESEPWDFELHPVPATPRDEPTFDEDDELVIWVEFEDEDQGESEGNAGPEEWDLRDSDDGS